MVRTLEDDIDFARCEISSALFGLENIGLEILRQVNLCDEGWNDNAQVNLYRSADMFYKNKRTFLNTKYQLSTATKKLYLFHKEQ